MVKVIDPYFEIIDDLNGDEILKRIERAGRTCYKSEDRMTTDSSRKFVAFIMSKGHESVLEHEKISVRIICDRGVTHEIVRHRLASYSQESTRYCNYAKTDEITVIRPYFWNWNDIAIAQGDMENISKHRKYEAWFAAMYECEKAYMHLIRLGASPQEARSVLPNSLKTEIVMTCNLREWRHFFKLRTSKAAHPQMREITIPLLNELKKRIPIIFDDIIPE